MRSRLFVILVYFLFPGFAAADAVCKDGWISKSSGSGTCSWHGGVSEWLDKKVFNYKVDTYYDDSDNGIDRCKYRGYRESRKECQERLKRSDRIIQLELGRWLEKKWKKEKEIQELYFPMD